MGVDVKDLKPLFEDVAKEMAQYEAVVQERASRQFVGRDDFLARYSGLGGGSYWREKFDEAKPAPKPSYSRRLSMSDGVKSLDVEKAKPFIRAVIERMLDLLASEENWIKGAEARTEDGIDKYCLVGAKAKALKDLTLAKIQSDPTVEEQRQRVLKAVDAFLTASLKREKGYTSMPGFNDRQETTFEDVRLWLKGTLSELD